MAHFNPRTREGCDFLAYGDYRLAHISIHAPVKGATLLFSHVSKFQFISIHAPVKGATFKRHFSLSAINDFNPRTREGCDERRTEWGFL